MGVITLVFAAIAKTLFSRQEELFRTKAGNKDLDQTLTRFDKHMDSCDVKNREFADKLDQINSTLAHTNTTLAVMASKLEDDRSKRQ